MRKLFFNIIIVTATVCLSACSSLPFVRSSSEAKLKPFLGEPSIELQQVFKNQRFPNIVVAMDGALVATWGSDSVIARRSVDGGNTWGPVITIAKPGFQGGGVTVDEKNGDIFAFIEEGHPPAPVTVYRSKDSGKNWQEEEAVNRHQVFVCVQCVVFI